MITKTILYDTIASAVNDYTDEDVIAIDVSLLSHITDEVYALIVEDAKTEEDGPADQQYSPVVL